MHGLILALFVAGGLRLNLGAPLVAPLMLAQEGGGGGGAPPQGGQPGAPPGPTPAQLYAQKLAKQRALAHLKAIFKDEPSIREVQALSLHFYRLEPERINSRAAAARSKALVPDIQASLTNMTGQTFTNMKDGLYIGLPLGADGQICGSGSANDPSCGYKEVTQQTQGQLTWMVQASWGLDKLVFNAEELDALSTVSLEETLIREVTTMYFARRRLIASLVLTPPDSEEEVYMQQLRIEEMTSTLDAYTNGEFGKRAFKGEYQTAAAPAGQ